jgi:DNA polymerase III psi subunit
MTQTIPFDLQEKIASLQAALLDAHHKMPGLLHDIHKTLRAQPENVTLLSEEQIQIVVAGLEKQTNTHLVQSVSKSAKKATAVTAIKKLGTDAF